MAESPWSHLIMSTREPARTEPPALLAPPAPPARWRPLDIVGGLAVLVALQALQVVLFWGETPGTRLGLSIEVARYFPTVITAYVVLLLAHRRGMSPGDIGFRRPRSWRPALYAWAGAVLAGPAYAVVLLLLGQDFDTLTTGTIGQVLWRVVTRPLVLLAIFGIVVVAPVVEEIIFRGLLFSGLRGRWPLLPALVLTGVLFAAFHFEGARLVPLALIGALFAIAYERTASLWAAIVPHAGLNFMVLVIAFAR